MLLLLKFAARMNDYKGRSFVDICRGIRENDPDTNNVSVKGGDDNHIQNMTLDNWDELGRDIANNTHLKELSLTDGALNNQTMSSLFRGLTRSNILDILWLFDNKLSAEGVISMVPFLQNANNLIHLDIDDNNIQSEGFNTLLRALRDSPIEGMHCCGCGIESIEIDSENVPKQLKKLWLRRNIINADGCHGLAKLLQGRDSTLKILHVADNKIDDHGVEILVGALQKNTSLTEFQITENDDISDQGQCMLLKLVNDVSSIKATLQSNHTLRHMYVFMNELICDRDEAFDEKNKFQRHIDEATARIWSHKSPEEIGREKVIETQLNSTKRAVLAELQGVNHSVYSTIDPLHLPEVLGFLHRRHWWREFHLALSSSIMTLLSTVNVKVCIQQERAHHEAKIAEHAAIIAELDAKLAAIDSSNQNVTQDTITETKKSKRRRVG